MGDNNFGDTYGYNYNMSYTHHAMVGRPNDRNIITVVRWKKVIALLCLFMFQSF